MRVLMGLKPDVCWNKVWTLFCLLQCGFFKRKRYDEMTTYNVKVEKKKDISNPTYSTTRMEVQRDLTFDENESFLKRWWYQAVMSHEWVVLLDWAEICCNSVLQLYTTYTCTIDSVYFYSNIKVGLFQSFVVALLYNSA